MVTKEELKIYGDIVYNHKLSIRSMAREFLLKLFAKKYRVKESIYEEGAAFPSLVKDQQIRYLAVIKDGVVVEMLRLKAETAEILVKPKVKLVSYDPRDTIVKKGMLFSDKKFIERKSEENEKED
jgi:hypothetical protein